MHNFAFSLKNAAFVFSFLICISNSVHALTIEGRADCCIGHCDDDDNGNQAPTLDGPTDDQSPGIGVEFESSDVRFSSPSCDKPSTDEAKGKLVNDRQGKNWQLTADTTQNEAGMLYAEYILDGTQIKLGTGAAAEAASAVGRDFVR